MSPGLDLFEQMARWAWRSSGPPLPTGPQHPFEERDIHAALPRAVRKLFDNAHYAQATFEACLFLDNEVQRLSGCDRSGEKLMMEVLNESKPILRLNSLKGTSDMDEQRGYRFLFSGTLVGIRNPRGHKHSVPDSLDVCLEHLSLISHLLRKLERAGYQVAGRGS